MKINLKSGKRANYPIPLVSVEKEFKKSEFMKNVGKWQKVPFEAQSTPPPMSYEWNREIVEPGVAVKARKGDL